MKRRAKVAALLASYLCLIAAHQAMAQVSGAKQSIGPAAVWQPGAQLMENIRQECAPLSGPVFEDCFFSAMARSGATPEALAFTRGSGSLAYVREFLECGRVDVAFVAYPFRANENTGILLVNGYPAVIDVDKLNALPKSELQKDPLYSHLAEDFPQIAVWPGDRYSREDLAVENMPGGGQRFILGYRLLNGCHACELIGHARFAFVFNGLGNFTGITLISLDNKVEEKESTTASAGGGEEQLEAAVGESFSITLESNPTTGYKWELSDPVDTRIIKLVGSAFRAAESKLLGAGGREIWTFKAVGKGRTEIRMKYVRPWEKDIPPIETEVIKVNVH
jgi:predicted secreted protein